MQITFSGYNSVLKTLWKRGKLKTVTRGLYGGRLTRDNLSLEHIIPHCKGGKTALNNLALATKNNNNKRGSEPIQRFLTKEMLEKYLGQFRSIKLPKFDGNKYIEAIRILFNELQ